MIIFLIFNFIADINECEDPRLAARCVENAECCNLPANFLCKCKPGFKGDGEERCDDIDECLLPGSCGEDSVCINTPGNFTCVCQEGFTGNPYQQVCNSLIKVSNKKVYLKFSANIDAKLRFFLG